MSRPQTPQSETGRRTSLLRGLSHQKNSSFRRSFLGRTLEAVVIRKAGDRVELLTANYLKVLAGPGPWNEGDAVRVVVERIEDRSTRGAIQD